MKPPPRRALSQRDGEVLLHGPEALAAPLAQALRLPHIEGPPSDPDVLTHGLHVWPARMHRTLAGALLDILGPHSRTVLDPFAGGGTVAVEALVRGHRITTVDANPLSERVIRAKTRRTRPDDREAFGVLLEHLETASLERVQTRVDARAELSPEHRGLYGPHVLKELAGLLAEIRAIEGKVDPADLEACLVLFAALVVKVSNKRADTSDDEVQKRIRKGLSTELFVRKGRELIARWAQLEDALEGRATPPLRAFSGDARRLDAGLRADLILTSPPYGGTYDYLAHHALRLEWLGLPLGPFDRAEIGSRRRTDSVARWDRELGESLAAMRAVLSGPEARIALVIGDAQVGPRRVDAHHHVVDLARRTGLVEIASASIEREDFRGGPPRFEHVVVLGPS